MRDETKICSNCRSWKPTYEGSRGGDCRAKTPVILVIGYSTGDELWSGWPETKSVDWCKEFERKSG